MGTRPSSPWPAALEIRWWSSLLLAPHARTARGGLDVWRSHKHHQNFKGLGDVLYGLLLSDLDRLFHRLHLRWGCCHGSGLDVFSGNWRIMFATFGNCRPSLNGGTCAGANATYSTKGKRLDALRKQQNPRRVTCQEREVRIPLEEGPSVWTSLSTTAGAFKSCWVAGTRQFCPRCATDGSQPYSPLPAGF